MNDRTVSIRDLILVPSILTLAVTLLRLVGELQGWSPALFSRAAGGGGALVGISWLIPVFGFYFGWRLARMGVATVGAGRLAAMALLGIALMFGAAFGLQALQAPFLVQLVAFGLVAVVGVVLVYRCWPLYGRTLIAYGLAARVPVAIVMLVAILGSWGTHYDVAPPNAPEIDAMAPLLKWFWIGLLPQLTVWIATTVCGGAVLGALGVVLGRRR